MPRRDTTRRERERDDTRSRDEEAYGAYYRRGAREGAYGYGDDRYERQADERDESRRSMGFMGDRERDRRGAYERENPDRGPHAWYGSARRYDEARGRGGEDGGHFDRVADYRSRAPGSQRYTSGYPYGASRANEPVDRYDAYGRHVSGYRSTVRGGGDGSQTSGYSGTHDQYITGGEYAPQENHRGRGPKNYTRSDERIREDLSERLAEDDVIDASDITVDVKNGVVTLSGTVAARHQKHRTEDIADHCGGVKDVENRLSVKQPSVAARGKEDAGKKH